MEVELDSQEPRRYQEEGSGAELSRTQEGSRAGWCSWALKNLGEIKSGEVEGGCMDGCFNCLAAKFFRNSCVSSSVFVNTKSDTERGPERSCRINTQGS